MKPLVPVVRPKGLGLGADKSILLQTSNNKHKHVGSLADEETLVLKCGSHCMLLGGSHDGLYGTVSLPFYLFIGGVMSVFCLSVST